MHYINRHSILVYCMTVCECVSIGIFSLKTCELNNVQSGCVPFFHVHTFPFVSPCTCQHAQDAALEMQSCFLVGVTFEFALARRCLCCPLLLCFLASVLGKVSNFSAWSQDKMGFQLWKLIGQRVPCTLMLFCKMEIFIA